jgi:hypothetical protein
VQLLLLLLLLLKPHLRYCHKRHQIEHWATFTAAAQLHAATLGRTCCDEFM